MISALCVPVMGEEINETDDNIWENDSVIDNDSFGGGINSIIDDGSGIYYGRLCLKEDGFFYDDGRIDNLKGITWDQETLTLTLDNFSLGAEYDDIYDESKAWASLDLLLGNDRSVGTKDITISLNGHNHIGSYSNFSRYTATNASGIDGRGINSVTFTGNGDLTVRGGLEIYKSLIWGEKVKYAEFKTDLPVWGTDKSLSECFSGDLKIGGDKPDNIESFSQSLSISDNLGDFGVKKELGTFGGHSVSVCYTDSITYDGRKIVNYSDYGLVVTSSNNFSDYRILDDSKYFHLDSSHRFWPADTVSTVSQEYCFYNSEKSEGEYTSSKAPEMYLKVFVDGLPVPNCYVKTKFRNNVNATVGKTVSASFSFKMKDSFSHKISQKEKKEIVDYYNNNVMGGYAYNITDINIANTTKSLGLGKNFYKELNDYFKNKNNWLTFTIVPKDIISTGFGTNKYEYRFIFPNDFEINRSRLKNDIKVEGEKVKKFNLKNVMDLNDKNLFKKIKWDKKYTEGNADLKKDYHLEIVSANYIKITGQGNYTNSVIIGIP